MKKKNDLGRSAHTPKWLRHLVSGMIPSALAVAYIAAPQIARADVITYNLDMTAEVSSYSNAVYGDFITASGQFQYDDVLAR